MEAHFRPAQVEDCRRIARLFLISSDGLAGYIWQQLAEPGEALEDVGTRRYARVDEDFSYQHCLIVEVGGVVAGMLHSYPMHSTGEPVDDPVLRPASELEDPGSLYISAVALFPEYRNHGIGGALLEAAQQRALQLKLPRTSLLCFEANLAAMRLYERLDYREVDRRTLVPHPCLHYDSGDAVLMVKSLTP